MSLTCDRCLDTQHHRCRDFSCACCGTIEPKRSLSTPRKTAEQRKRHERAASLPRVSGPRGPRGPYGPQQDTPRWRSKVRPHDVRLTKIVLTNGGSITEAARGLGMQRRTLARAMKSLTPVGRTP